MDTRKTRRRFLKNTAISASLLPLSAFSMERQLQEMPKKKIVCLGGHPDDPETGCGGTLAKFAKAGHNVTNIYLTTGEAGIPGYTHSQAAGIRKQEAIKACSILNAKPIFAGQTDGDTILNNVWINKIQKIIVAENPDIVFTHWPIDYHHDHQVASILAIQTWMKMDKKFSLYFFEVMIGLQTAVFHPTDYIDITDTRNQKWDAINCHVSQKPQEIFDSSGHRAMEEFRGLELGVKAAEAFVRMTGRLQGGIVI